MIFARNIRCLYHNQRPKHILYLLRLEHGIYRHRRADYTGDAAYLAGLAPSRRWGAGIHQHGMRGIGDHFRTWQQSLRIRTNHQPRVDLNGRTNNILIIKDTFCQGEIIGILHWEYECHPQIPFGNWR